MYDTIMMKSLTTSEKLSPALNPDNFTAQQQKEAQ